jgi:hypothetical protein
MPSQRADRLAVHLTLRWRNDVLAVRRVASEGLPVGALAPIPCPTDLLGFVFAEVASGLPVAFAPSGEVVTVWRAAGGVELVEGPATISLAAGDVAELALGDFVLAASAGPPETMARVRQRRAAAVWGVALAALAHAVVLGLAANDARASSAEDTEADRTEQVRGLLASAELRTRAAEPPPLEDGTGQGEGLRETHARGDGRKGGGARASGAEGKMGGSDARPGADRRYAVPADRKKDPSPSASREEAMTDAASFGMIGLLGQGPLVPSAPFADPFAHGEDALAARGSLWAYHTGETFGPYGLGLAGIGEGGGGRGEGIGLGNVGTLGHTNGAEGPGLGGDGSVGQGFGCGCGHWGGLRGHHARAPTVRWGDTVDVSGRLPPEAIQRIVRQNFGRFRACYETKLRQNPTLAGTVTTRFVIGRDGSVSSAAGGGSTMTDPDVTSCVVRAFYGVSFPQPEGGIVTVSYPIVFSPQ